MIPEPIEAMERIACEKMLLLDPASRLAVLNYVTALQSKSNAAEAKAAELAKENERLRSIPKRAKMGDREWLQAMIDHLCRLEKEGGVHSTPYVMDVCCHVKALACEVESIRLETLKEAANVIMNGGDGKDRMELAIRLGPNAAIADSVLALADKPLRAILSRERKALDELRAHLEEDGGATCDIGTMMEIIEEGQGQ